MSKQWGSYGRFHYDMLGFASFGSASLNAATLSCLLLGVFFHALPPMVTGARLPLLPTTDYHFGTTTPLLPVYNQ